MSIIRYPVILALAVFLSFDASAANESKELQKQRQAAQKERQNQKNQRSREISDGTKAFREYARELKSEYGPRANELDTQFELKRIELGAEHDAEVARAEADYQQKLSGLFTKSGQEFNEQTVAQLQADSRAFAEELFSIRKQAAQKVHQARIAKEERKNALLTERDRMVLDRANAAGLTKSYAPILATPIGGSLTEQEKKWNEREKNEVAKLEERNRKSLAEFRNGEKLRSWEIQNLNEDFKLTWDEKAEVHALDAEQILYNSMLTQAVQAGAFDQQKFMNQMAELGKKKQLIKIEYKKIRDQRRIERREERKKIVAE